MEQAPEPQRDWRNVVGPVLCLASVVLVSAVLIRFYRGEADAAFAALTAMEKEVASLRDYVDRQRDDSPENVAKRNIVWRRMNGESTPLTNESLVGEMMARILDPNGNDEWRAASLQQYAERAMLYLTEEDTALIAKAMIESDPEDIARAMKRLSEANLEAERFSLSVLKDEQRIGRFVTGDFPLPLETLPDGSTP